MLLFCCWFLIDQTFHVALNPTWASRWDLCPCMFDFCVLNHVIIYFFLPHTTRLLSSRYCCVFYESAVEQMLRSCLRSSICSNRWAASTKPYFAWPPPNPLLHISKHLSSESSRQKNPQLPPLSDLKSLCIEDRLKEAILEMGIQGLRVDFDGYDSLLAVCINQNAVREGQRVHSHMIKTRYFPPVFLNTRLVIMYVKFGFLEDARRVFDGMSERNVVSWTAVISGCARRGRRYEALGLFLRMLETGGVHDPTVVVVVVVMPGFSGVHGPSWIGLSHILSKQSLWHIRPGRILSPTLSSGREG